MDYKKIKEINSENLCEIYLESKDELDLIDTNLRFKKDLIDPISENVEGEIYIAIKDNIVYFLYPKEYKISKNELGLFAQNPEEMKQFREERFQERVDRIKDIKKIAKEISEIPEWKKCKNKNQRAIVIDQYIYDTNNRDLLEINYEDITGYIMLYYD